MRDRILKEVNMRWAKPLFLVATLAVFCAGCATHLDYFAYSNTRKFMDSGAPGITKGVCAPLVFLPDTIGAPFACYKDALNHAPESKGGHVYLSYVGFRTLMQSDLGTGYKWVGGTMVAITDTIWFPVSGLTDLIYAVFM
jgi:hypothetical protein